MVKLFISPNPPLLWILIIASYIIASLQVMSSIHDLPYVVITSVTSVLVSSAFAFKLAFTAEDAPELVTGFAKKMNDTFHGQSLLSRARVVFAVLLLVASFAIYQARKGGSKAISSGMSLSSHKTTISKSYMPLCLLMKLHGS